MLHWIIYDISNDRKRTTVSEKCKNYGLQRVQKSAFLGNVSKNKLDMLAIELKDVLKDDGKEKEKKTSEKVYKNDDAIFIFPSCKSCFSEKHIEGKFDEDAIRKKDFYFLSG